MIYFSQLQIRGMRRTGQSASAGSQAGKNFQYGRRSGKKALLLLPILSLTYAPTARQGRAQTAVSAPPAPRSVQAAPAVPSAVSLPAPAAFDYAGDARLAQKISLQCRSVSFSELCRRMQAATGIAFTASPLTADDNITLFCHERSLADILPQIERLFNFTWQRAGDKAAFRYDLTQTPLQIAQERTARELDKISALAGLDKDMERYRPYLAMTKEQVQEKLAHGTREEKSDIDDMQRNCASVLYLGLSVSEKAELMRGVPLTFTASAGNMGRIPAESFSRQVKLAASFAYLPITFIDGVQQPPRTTEAQVLAATDVVMRVIMHIRRDKGGHYTFDVDGTLFIPSLHYNEALIQGSFTLYTAARRGVDNRRENAALANDAAMRRTVALDIKPTYAKPISVPSNDQLPEAPAIISADYDEAVFKAAGTDVMADSFADLRSLKYMKTQPQSLFDLLCSNYGNRRWRREEGWLTFRDAGCFNKRALQIPNRLLERWASGRRERGAASLDDIAEMAQTAQVSPLAPGGRSDIPEQSLDEEWIVQGIMMQAYARYGLLEWGLAHDQSLQAHCHFLGRLPPELRALAVTPRGLPFSRLPLGLRAEFTHLAYGGSEQREQPGLPDLIDSSLRVEYRPMSRLKNPLLLPDLSGDAGLTLYSKDADGTFSVMSTPNTAPLRLNPDWKLRFIYTYGRRGPGRTRRVLSTDENSLSEAGQIKD